MSLDRHTSTERRVISTPISNQIGAWLVADTLKTHLEKEPIEKDKALLLMQMALDLADWLEDQTA